MNLPTKRSGYVVPALDSARIDAQWERIAGGLPKRRQRHVGQRVAMAFALACVFGAVWWWRPSRSVDSGWAGSRMASDDAPLSFSLAEGTQVDVEPYSQLELLQSDEHTVQMSLARGSARFDVAKRRARRFSVQMGPVEVVVTGTQFRVSRRASAAGERVRVSVEEGSVEVHRNGHEVVRLAAGDHWSGMVPSDAPERVLDDGDVASAEDVDHGADDAVAEGDGADEGEAGDGATDDAAQRRRRRFSLARGTARLDFSLARGTARRQRHLAAFDAATEAATDLFDQANVLRRSGQLREAAGLFAELVATHPKDRRAALSAFELGRLRMDSLGDTRGAVDALERALKLDARRAFAEDALARLVMAHEALGELAACGRARDRYLVRYPEGVHAQQLLGRCVSD